MFYVLIPNAFDSARPLKLAENWVFTIILRRTMW